MSLEYNEPATQKALGIKKIANDPWFSGMAMEGWYLIQSAGECHDAATYFSLSTKIFARPCPMLPRHGFAESRIVKGETHTARAAHLAEIFAEARSLDPGAEVLVGRWIESESSAILTPTALAIGWKHDGATAGHDSFLFPLATPASMPDSSAAGIVAPEVPYIETVTGTDGVVRAVQLRAGPNIPVGPPDRVYSTRSVKTVLDSKSYDDISWEKLMASLGKAHDHRAWDDAGVVAVHPGGTQACHHAIHALKAGVAFLTTAEQCHYAEVGAELDKTTDPANWRWVDFVDGIQAGYLCQRYSLTAAIAVLHHAIACTGEYSWLLGAAVATIHRYALAAIHGERRHKKSGGKKKKLSRDTVFAAVLQDFAAVLKARRDLPDIHGEFCNPALWSSMMGGKAWAGCTEATVRLDEAIRQVLRIGLLTSAVKGGKQAAIQECFSAAHVIINAAHNTGKFLNKWVTPNKFDAAANVDGRLLLKESPVLWHWFTLKEAFARHRDVSEICQRMARSHSLVGKLTVEVGVKLSKAAPASKPIENSIPKATVNIENLALKVHAIQKSAAWIHIQAALVSGPAVVGGYAKLDVALTQPSLPSGDGTASASFAGSGTVYTTLGRSKAWKQGELLIEKFHVGTTTSNGYTGPVVVIALVSPEGTIKLAVADNG